MCRDGTLIEILLVAYLESQRREAVRCFIRSGTKIIADVEGGSFIMVAHGILYILNGEFAFRLYEQRHRVIGLSLDIRQIGFTLVGKHIEVAPHTGFTETAGTEIERCISIGKAEVFVHTAEISFFAGKRNNVIRIHAVGLVSHIELMDARLVGMCRNAVVRHSDSYPYGSPDAGTFTYHLHNPYFIGIGNGERLATAVISVFLHQFSHHLDGFTGSTRTLQPHVNQASVVDNSQRIHQFGTASKSRLTDGYLKLVHITDYIISLACLFDLSQIFAGIPFVNIHHGAFGICGCRIVIQLAKKSVRVGRIGNDG